ncbi:hypothetical protein B0O99DRAFT_256939 [Bisporella sp. PMI_857]|nr:hypothetical protein B0O99DRAFT_256939 [Bisporella sp. PMI_857]
MDADDDRANIGREEERSDKLNEGELRNSAQNIREMRERLEKIQDDLHRRISQQRHQQSPFSDPIIVPGIYAPSGFDIMDILVAVSNRRNPTVDLGSIDDSVAFIVCDPLEDDMPIIYCNESFRRLTGYSESEIINRNCRFLQSPPSPSASKEPLNAHSRYVDVTVNNPDKHDSVILSRNIVAREVVRDCLANRSDCQISFINYRHNGEIFENLVTIVPVVLETQGGKRYLVGFQADRGPVG